MDCLFCKIIAKQISAHIVYENDHVVAMLDIHPRAPGHIMILPKAHRETLLEVPDNELQPIFAAVKKVIARLKEVLNPDGFTIGINHGKASGQEINHLHIHILPRSRGDGWSSIQSVVNNPPKESLDDIYKRLRMS